MKVCAPCCRLLPGVHWQTDIYGGVVSPNVCVHPSILPPVLVNRWSNGRVEKEGEREAQKKRVMQNAEQKEEQLTPHNESQT